MGSGEAGCCISEQNDRKGPAKVTFELSPKENEGASHMFEEMANINFLDQRTVCL